MNLWDVIPLWLGGIGALGGIGVAIFKGWHAAASRFDQIDSAVETITGVPAQGGRDPIEPLPQIVKKQGETIAAVSQQVAALQAGQDEFHGRIATQVKGVGEAVETRAAGIDEALAAVKAELQGNGAPLRDHMLALETTVTAVDTRLSDAIGKFDSQHKENVAHLDDLGGRLGELEVQVRTANGLPLGELADRVEGRDIERNIPPEKRTEMEQSYVDRLHPEEETK